MDHGNLSILDYVTIYVLCLFRGNTEVSKEGRQLEWEAIVDFGKKHSVL